MNRIKIAFIISISCALLVCGISWSIPKPTPISYVYYTCGKDDTLSDLALVYHGDVAEIKAVNKLQSDYIMRGQNLLIPTETEID